MSVGEVAAAGQTVFDVVEEARVRLQRVFVVFLIGLVGTIWALRAFVWDFLREVTEARMSEVVAADLDVIARTPFDVILLQAKIGLVVGASLAIPLLVYYGRDALIRRGVSPEVPVSRGKRYGLVGASALLAVGGIVYAYAFFFPFMFGFLAGNAVQSGVYNQYDIVYWTQFIILLTISFGLAAQVPLVMSVASYTEIIPYEFFRDKWKYAIILIFLFGAIFSPPDPLTQILWALPLTGIYFFSLALAKLAANLHRAGAAADPTVRQGLRRKTVYTAILGVLGALGGTVLAWFDLTRALGDVVRPAIPAAYRPAGDWSIEPHLPADGLLGEVLFGLEVGVGVLLLIATISAVRVLRRPIPPSASQMITADPTELDLRPLDAEGLRAAPIEAFAALEENEAVAIASSAIDEGDTERAEVVLQRFDEAQELAEAEALDVDAAEAEDSGGRLRGAAANVMDAFTEEETTEEDIGGYMYDIVFIYESLTSRMFRLLLVFLGTIFATFYWLYSGGLGQLQRDFLARLPADVAETSDLSFPVALHPAEHLLFEVKISLIVATVATLPLLLYYAWPAMRERSLVTGDRRVFLVWGWLLLGALAAGSAAGYSFVAPTIISGLVYHSLDAGMIISYRLNSYAWLIVFTTVGIGLLIGILMSMVLFHLTGIVRYETMRRRWRGVVLLTFIAGSVFTPGTILTMFLVTIPLILTFLVGLAILWLLTLPRRLGRGGGPTVQAE
ncbi:MAG: twin-arginine translocase subunit TatC [Halobacteriales archaeon]